MCGLAALSPKERSARQLLAMLHKEHCDNQGHWAVVAGVCAVFFNELYWCLKLYYIVAQVIMFPACVSSVRQLYRTFSIRRTRLRFIKIIILIYISTLCQALQIIILQNLIICSAYHSLNRNRFVKNGQLSDRFLRFDQSPDIFHFSGQ